jgi:uncharacterized protein YjbJ (UPF0337 family)
MIAPWLRSESIPVTDQVNEEAIMIKRSVKNKAEGTFHEWKGTIKSKVGKATNNTRLQAKGTVEKAVGKIQKKIGQMEEVIGKR